MKLVDHPKQTKMSTYKLSEKYPQKRAFITGAASGLGKALCEHLSKDGWTIGISDIDLINLNATASMIQQNGGKAIAQKLNVADSDEYKQVVDAFLSQTGGIDLLVNNAGVGDAGAMGEYSLENWNWVVDINQMGVIYGCHFFVPIMKQQQSGYIINIASAAAFVSTPNMGAYNATKAAVRAISETLSLELRSSNIGVSAVMPTFFKTNIMQHARGGEEYQVMGKKMMEKSNLEASTVADEILRKAGRGKLNIILPFQARFLFFMKRFFPSIFYNLLYKMYQKEEAFLKKVVAQKEKEQV